MGVRRRRGVLVLGAALGTASVLLASTPATAVLSYPSWPSAGRLPSGCTSVTPTAPGGVAQFDYVDTTRPTLVSFSLVGGGTTLTIPPAGRRSLVQATFAQPCSGVGDAAAYVEIGGALAYVPGVRLNSDAFRPTVRMDSSVTLTPDDAGPMRIPFFGALTRYGTFSLDLDYRLLPGATAGAGVSWFGASATTTYYLLRASDLTSALSKAKVRKGKKVTVSGVLRYAEPASYAADDGGKVEVQTRVGTRAWKTRATLTADGTGAVSWKFKPAKTTQVRLVKKALLSGRYTAATTSAVRTVKIG
jgi:hypothetical protein